MICGDNAKFLKTEEGKFTPKDGKEITFYRLKIIPQSDNEPIEVTCSKDVHDYALQLKPFDDVYVEIEIYQRERYIKTRCNFIGTPSEGQYSA